MNWQKLKELWTVTEIREYIEENEVDFAEFRMIYNIYSKNRDFLRIPSYHYIK